MISTRGLRIRGLLLLLSALGAGGLAPGPLVREQERIEAIQRYPGDPTGAIRRGQVA